MATRRKQKKKITLSEFKTWLAGVQSMQPDGWHPNKDNWVMILEQIENITETVVEKKVLVSPPEPDKTVPPVPLHYDDPRNPANAVHNQQSFQPPANAPASSIPLATPDSGKLPGKQSGDNGLLAVDIKGDGKYESSFS